MSVDGFCKDKTKFFNTFKEAFDYAKRDCHIWDDNGNLKFETMQDARIKTDNISFFQMIGIPYKEIDYWDSKFGNVEITQEEFSPNNENFFELMSDNGYANTQIYGDPHITNSIDYFQTREEAEEVGNKFKNYYKSWKDGCHGLDFTGEFLFVSQREIISNQKQV